MDSNSNYGIGLNEEHKYDCVKNRLIYNLWHVPCYKDKSRFLKVI